MPKPVTTELYQVTSPYFCAGADAINGTITQAAPILHWLVSHPVQHLLDYARRRRWHVSRIHTTTGQPPTMEVLV